MVWLFDYMNAFSVSSRDNYEEEAGTWVVDWNAGGCVGQAEWPLFWIGGRNLEGYWFWA
jgi:hypothetical protein